MLPQCSEEVRRFLFSENQGRLSHSSEEQKDYELQSSELDRTSFHRRWFATLAVPSSRGLPSVYRLLQVTHTYGREHPTATLNVLLTDATCQRAVNGSKKSIMNEYKFQVHMTVNSMLFFLFHNLGRYPTVGVKTKFHGRVQEKHTEVSVSSGSSRESDMSDKKK